MDHWVLPSSNTHRLRVSAQQRIPFLLSPDALEDTSHLGSQGKDDLRLGYSKLFCQPIQSRINVLLEAIP